MQETFGEMLAWLKTSGLRVLVIGIGGVLLVRLLHAVADRILRLMANGGEPTITEREKRARTLAGVAIGFGAQSLIKDVIAGFFILKEWSRAVLEVGVGYAEDVDRVIGILTEVGRAFANDEAYGKLVLEPPQVLGVEAPDESQVTIRMLAKTLPLKQWDVARELRRRIKASFDREGIQIPYPHRVIITRPAS